MHIVFDPRMSSTDLLAKRPKIYRIVFTGTLFIVEKNWQHPKCVLMENRLNNLYSIHTMKYIATIKNNEHTKLDGFFFWPYHRVSGILVPQLGTEPGPLAVKARSLNHWIAREFSKFDTFEESSLSIYCAPAQSSLTLCNPMDCSSPGSLFMGFFRQEYWSVLPCPPPVDPPNPGTEPMSPVSQVDSLPAEPLGTPF